MPLDLGVGATAVGIKGRDAVVLAAEKRVSLGGFILSKSGRKVFKITDRLGIACAGLVADMQAISRIIAVEARYYELSLRKAMSVKSAAKLLANVLYSFKLTPLLAETIVGGVDSEGPHIFVMDPLGSIIEEKYAAVGTGAPIAIGVIESEYRDDMEIADMERLAISSLKEAISRDALSGDGIEVLTISSAGAQFKEVKL